MKNSHFINVKENIAQSSASKKLIFKHIFIIIMKYILIFPSILGIFFSIFSHHNLAYTIIFVIVLILTYILIFKYSKSINKILLEQCDPKTFLSILKINYKLTSKNNLKNFYLLNIVLCYLLTGEYDKAYNILNSINENSLPSIQRYLFNIHFCNYYFSIQNKEKFQECWNKFLYFVNNSQSESIKNAYSESIETFKIYQANLDNDLVLERELRESIKSELKSVLAWINYNYFIGIIDIKEGRYDEGKKKLTYVIKHGNTTKFVNLAHDALNTITLS